jgi:uncharacterized protein (DUF58 family)
MLQAIAITLILLWALGLATSYTLGGYIHVLVGLAVAMFLFRALVRRRGPHRVKG